MPWLLVLIRADGVAVPGNRLNKLRVMRIWFNSLAQVFDVHTHKVGAARVRRIIPNLIEQAARREDFTGMTHQVVEQVKLHRGQAHFTA